LLLGGPVLLMWGSHWYKAPRKHFQWHFNEKFTAFSPTHRNREIKQMKDCMKNGNSFSFLSHDINELEHSYQLNLPRVTVIMPLKGFGEHNLHNWRSQVITYMTCPWYLFEVSNILVSVQCLFGSSQVIVIHYK